MAEPNLAGGGFAGRRQAAPAGARPQGPSWMTGGLNFDTSGIKDFTKEIKDAAKAVTALFKPFEKLDVQGRQVDAFFDKLKRRLDETSKLAGSIALPGTGGVGAPRAIGTGRRTSVEVPTTPGALQPDQVFPRSVGRGSFANGGTWAMPRSNLGYSLQRGMQQFQMGSGSGGGRAVLPTGVSVGLSTAFAAAGMGASYVMKNQDRQATNDLTAFMANQAAGRPAGGYLSQYRQIAFGGGPSGAFASGTDRAQAASLLFANTGFGPNTRTIGGGTIMGSMGQLGLANPNMTGAQQAAVTGGLMGPGAANNLMMLGINVSPGGTPRSNADIFNQLTSRLFRGNRPTEQLLNYVARSGTPGNNALTQMLGGDQDTVQAYLGHLRAQVSLGGGPLPTDERGYAAALQRTGITNDTLQGTLRARQDAQGKVSALADQGAIDAQKQTNIVLSRSYDKLVDIGRSNQRIADILGRVLGYGAGLNGLLGGAERFGGGIVGGALPYIGGALGRTLLGRGGPAAATAAGGPGAAATGVLGTLGTAASVAVPLAGGVGVGMAAEQVIQGGNPNPSMGQNVLGKAGFGASVGAGIGLAGGPFDPISVPVGAAVGGLVGAGVGFVQSLFHHNRETGDPVADAAAIHGPGRVMGMSSSLADKLAKMFMANPKLVLTSGFRTSAEQARLYAQEPGLAAPPGQSKHERGSAADVSDGSNGAWLSAHAREYGLFQPMPQKEPWHLEEVGGSGGGAVAQPSSGTSNQAGGAQAGLFLNAVSAPGLDVVLGGLLNRFTLGQHTALSMAGAGTGATDTSGASGGSAAPSGTPGDIPKQILQVGQSLGASKKVLLAAFEAGIVESGMRNLGGGDRDSAGVFQQRPSQGWGSYQQVTDVAYAASQFFKRAIVSGNGGTAGSLAQSVQRSAFPARYDQVRPQAASMLAQLGVDVSNVGDPVSQAPRSPQVSQRPIIVQNLKIELTIGRASAEEAGRFVRQLKDDLSSETNLLSLGDG